MRQFMPKALKSKAPAKPEALGLMGQPTHALDRAPGQAPGVIASIVEFLKDGGGTVVELTARLAERFPDRPAKGMMTTCRIQLVRLHKTGKLAITSEQVEGRGTVYRGS
jgi:hypothetical protein